MRVLHIISNLTTGGAEMMLYKILHTMNRERFESVVISLMDEGRFGKALKKAGLEVHTLGMKAGKPSVKAVWRLLHLIRSINPDIIQGWMPHGNLAASLSRVFLGKQVPVIWNIRHALYNIQHEKKGTAKVIKVGAMLSKRTAKIIYNSRVSAQQHQAFGYSASQTVIIPNGFDTQQFQPSQTAREKLRKTLQVPEDTFLIGLIARYHPVKDHANFLNAAARLAKAREDVQFVLAGRDVELSNPLIAELVQRQKLADRVHMLGERQDISDLTAGLDIATSSSYTESLPNTVGEAMACGVPCVVTDVGDSAWLVGETGKVVPPRDSEALAQAWMALMAMGTEQRKHLGEAARQRVMDNLSLTTITRQYERLYEQTRAM
jgi:glycosyltransferase involved in cell wall biosynthesis